MNLAPVSSRWKWIKRVFWLMLILALLYLSQYAFLLAYLVATGPLGGTEIVATDTSCGDGEYRIVVYQYRSGDGFLELMNRHGKVFDSSKYTRGVDYTPFDWDKDCKRVMVGSNDGLIFLKVK